MSQLAFSWPAAASYAPEDLIVSDCNRHAAEFIASWPQPQQYAALLSGPPASGKTHLAYSIAARTGAVMLDKSQLGILPSEQLWQGSRYAVCEDIDMITDETALFHLLRHAESSQGHVLLTARVNAPQLPFQLPDLRSRLLAMPSASIHEPDDAMLTAFFSKAFADRQWRIDASVIDYIVLRSERSFSAAQKLLQELEKLVTSTNREITTKLVRPLVESF